MLKYSNTTGICDVQYLPPNTFLPIYDTPIIADARNPLKEQICRKIYGKYDNPLVHEKLHSIMTDMDHFPYTRFFRGIYNDYKPHVMDREAGVVTHNNIAYNTVYEPIKDDSLSKRIYEGACTMCRPGQRPEHRSLLVDLPFNNVIMPI